MDSLGGEELDYGYSEEETQDENVPPGGSQMAEEEFLVRENRRLLEENRKLKKELKRMETEMRKRLEATVNQASTQPVTPPEEVNRQEELRRQVLEATCRATNLEGEVERLKKDLGVISEAVFGEGSNLREEAGGSLILEDISEDEEENEDFKEVDVEEVDGNHVDGGESEEEEVNVETGGDGGEITSRTLFESREEEDQQLSEIEETTESIGKEQRTTPASQEISNDSSRMEEDLAPPTTSSSSSSNYSLRSSTSSKRRNVGWQSSTPVVAAPNGSKSTLMNVAKSHRRISTIKPRPLKIHAVDTSKANEGFYCMCSLTFENQGRLTEHIKYFNADPKFQCDHCPLRFLQLSVMKKHMWSSHKTRFPSGTIGCADCGAIFNNREDHKAHRLQLHVKETEDHLKTHAIDQEEKGLNKCTCGKQFSSKNYLRSHVRLYSSNVFDWICKICGRIFKTLGSLQSHGRNVHNTQFFEGGTVGCNVCGEVFPSKKPFQQHMHRIHGVITWRVPEGPTMNRPGRRHGFSEQSSQTRGHSDDPDNFRCLCGSAFPNSKALRVHISLNRPKVPFKCTHCSGEFASHSRLKLHVMKVHGFKNYQGWGCTSCGKVYPSRVALRRHRDATHKQEQN